jgi:hypothetical protein
MRNLSKSSAFDCEPRIMMSSQSTMASKLRDLRDPDLNMSALQQSEALRFIWPPPLHAEDLSTEQKASIDSVIIVLRHISSFLSVELRDSETLRQTDAMHHFTKYAWLHLARCGETTWEEQQFAWDKETQALLHAVGKLELSFRGIMESDAMLSTFCARQWFLLRHPGTLVKHRGNKIWQVEHQDLDDAQIAVKAAKESLLTWEYKEGDRLGDIVSSNFRDSRVDGSRFVSQAREEGIVRCKYPVLIRVQYMIDAETTSAPSFHDLQTMEVRSPELKVTAQQDGGGRVDNVGLQ